MSDTSTKTPSAGDGLKEAVRGLGSSALSLGVARAGSSVQKLTQKLNDFTDGKKPDTGTAAGPVAEAVGEGAKAAASGQNPAVAALKGALSGAKDKVKEKLGGGGAKKSAKKFSNIVDSFDVGVPVRVAYNQWTQFEQWSEFMKKVEFAEVEEEEGKVRFKAKVFVLHRTWESTIVDMMPDEQIVWQSTGAKGYLNGAVTFHELAPRLTRLCLVVEYHPQGFWEHTLNLWRSVGSRVRLETKLYIHHVMTSTVLDPEAAQGWRAEIHDKQIVRSHDEVVEQEREEAEREDDYDDYDREDRDRDDQGDQEDEFDDEDREDDYSDDGDDGEDGEYDDESAEGDGELEPAGAGRNYSGARG